MIVIGGIIVVVVLGFALRSRTPTNQEKTINTVSSEKHDVLPTSDSSSVTSKASLDQSKKSLTPPQQPHNNMHLITLITNLGTIQFKTYDGDAPKTVDNFITLANKGFYDNLIFHRVIKGFMIQGGDPSGNGTGGPGYTFEDELNPQTESYKNGYKKGVVAMANAGPNTNGSQFFIMLENYPLPNNYTIFGYVVAGQDVVDKIGSLKTGPNDKPVEPVMMKSVKVEEEK